MDFFEFIIEGLKYVKKIEQKGGMEAKKGKIGNKDNNIAYNYTIRTGLGERDVKDEKLLEPVVQIAAEDIDLFESENKQLITINKGNLESFYPVIEKGKIFLEGSYQKIQLPGIVLPDKSRIQSWNYHNGIMIIKIT